MLASAAFESQSDDSMEQEAAAPAVCETETVAMDSEMGTKTIPGAIEDAKLIEPPVQKGRVIISPDNKPLKQFKEAPKVDEVADEIARMSMFVTQFYTTENMPKVTLPYGFIRGNREPVDMNMAAPGPYTLLVKNWYNDVFQDCLSYIRHQGEHTDAYEWYHDFIAFTNLQISLYNSPDLVNDLLSMEQVVKYASLHVRNLRSAVARNALSFVAIMLDAAVSNETVFTTLSLELLPQLFMGSTSEKVVYRKPSLDIISNICTQTNSAEVVSLLVTHCSHRNPKICSTAGKGVKQVLENINVTDKQEDMTTILKNAESILRGNNSAAKKAFTDFVKRTIAVLPQHHIDTLYSELDAGSKVASIFKPHTMINERVQEKWEECQPNEDATTAEETPTNVANTGETGITEKPVFYGCTY